MGLTLVRSLISLGAVALIALRVWFPEIKIDTITIGLLIVAVLPWLSSLLESAKFPGGWEVKFRDLDSAGRRITGGGFTRAASQPPSYLEISDQDPNLALVGLRIEIERRLRELARHHSLPANRPMTQLLRDLREREVLNDPSLSGLQELVHAGNQAAHGARVEPRAAEWAFTYGPQVLGALDAKLESFPGSK